jgi:hypothetical protein
VVFTNISTSLRETKGRRCKRLVSTPGAYDVITCVSKFAFKRNLYPPLRGGDLCDKGDNDGLKVRYWVNPYEIMSSIPAYNGGALQVESS